MKGGKTRNEFGRLKTQKDFETQKFRQVFVSYCLTSSRYLGYFPYSVGSFCSQACTVLPKEMGLCAGGGQTGLLVKNNLKIEK